MKQEILDGANQIIDYIINTKTEDAEQTIEMLKIMEAIKYALLDC